MPQTVSVEQNGQRFIWDGRRWYNAFDYTIPRESVVRELEQLVPEDARRAMLAEGAHERAQERERTLDLERQHTTAALQARLARLLKHAELLTARGGAELTYEDLLNTAEWHSRRLQILIRDRYQCRHCRGDGTGVDNHLLQVHHRYYVVNKLPWDYPDEDLMTLCKVCHTKLHEAGQVLVYEEVAGKLVRRNLKPCIRCLGAGFFPQWEHIEAGVCFRCRGARFDFDGREPEARLTAG